MNQMNQYIYNIYNIWAVDSVWLTNRNKNINVFEETFIFCFSKSDYYGIVIDLIQNQSFYN